MNWYKTRTPRSVSPNGSSQEFYISQTHPRILGLGEFQAGNSACFPNMQIKMKLIYQGNIEKTYITRKLERTVTYGNTMQIQITSKYQDKTDNIKF